MVVLTNVIVGAVVAPVGGLEEVEEPPLPLAANAAATPPPITAEIITSFLLPEDFFFTEVTFDCSTNSRETFPMYEAITWISKLPVVEFARKRGASATP